MRDSSLKPAVFKTMLTLVAMFTIGYAASMYALGDSALGLARQLTRYIGPTLLVAFSVLVVWGVVSAANLRSADTNRARNAALHLDLVKDNCRTLALCGTFAGMLAMLSDLAVVAAAGPDAFAKAVPKMLSGLDLVLSSSIAGYGLAGLFTNVEVLLSKHSEDEQILSIGNTEQDAASWAVPVTDTDSDRT